MTDPMRAALPWLAEPLARALALAGHALLVQGRAGSGSWQLARELARAWLCEAGAGARRPCGACTACHLVDAGSHPDLRLLVPDALRPALGLAGDDEGEGEEGAAGRGGKARAPSREIRIAALREAIDWGRQTSSRGRAKVIVLHPATAMNGVTANALLKTLEEPARLLRLVLTADEPLALLPTLLSRCQRVTLAEPDAAAADAWLAGQGVADAAALRRAAGGEPLRALAWHGRGVDAAAWRALPAALGRGDSSAFAGWSVPDVVDALRRIAHDCGCVAVGAAPRYCEPATLPRRVALAPLVAWNRELARIARHDEHPWNAPLLVESLVLGAAATLAGR